VAGEIASIRRPSGGHRPSSACRCRGGIIRCG
jgi:hypothetical protein